MDTAAAAPAPWPVTVQAIMFLEVFVVTQVWYNNDMIWYKQ